MLELVEVELALGRRRVGLRVVGEVDELDRDAVVGGGLLEGGPLRVALADDADLHDVVARVLARGGRGAGGEPDEQRHGRERGEELGGGA